MREKLAIWIAWHLPRDVVMWCMIRTFAHATTGRWGNDHVDTLGYKDIYDRWQVTGEAATHRVNLEAALRPVDMKVNPRQDTRTGK